MTLANWEGNTIRTLLQKSQKRVTLITYKCLSFRIITQISFNFTIIITNYFSGSIDTILKARGAITTV